MSISSWIRILGTFVVLVLSPQRTQVASAQTQEADQPFTLRMAIDEVSLAFHVFNKRGESIANLPPNSFRLWDSGAEQHRISSFHFYQDLPVRAGFLFDASGSMEKDLEFNEFIANLYAKLMLRPGRDRAFVMGFGTELQLTQNWTDDPKSIASGIRAVSGKDYGSSGTAIFDSLYKVCRDRWTARKDEISGNFILLFTDGIDDASHARLSDAIDMCQRTRTSIYIFTNRWNLRGSSQRIFTRHKNSSDSHI
jgi:Ca-activated chloride channel homolog